jgi:hypothetical protein
MAPQGSPPEQRECSESLDGPSVRYINTGIEGRPVAKAHLEIK